MSYSLKLFIFSWGLYLLLFLITPGYSLSSELGQVAILDILFVFIILFVANLTRYFLNIHLANNNGNYIFISTVNSNRLIILTLVLALLGLMALMIDKISVQHIDYFEGLASAREQWRRLGEEREGVSSIYSVIGYLLSTSFVVTIAVIMLNLEKIITKKIGAIIVAIFLLLMMNSILIGGRSIILLTIAYAFSFYAIKLERGGKRYLFSRKTKIGLLILFFLTMTYIVYVFKSRADATQDGMLASSYLESMQENMHIEMVTWPAILEGEFPLIGSIIIFGMIAITYLSHSAFTFAEYLEHHSQYTDDSIILFNHFRGMVSKIGIIDTQNSEFFLAGLFPSFPGALFHDGGYILLFMGTMTLGFIVGAANYCAQTKKISLLHVGFISSIYTIIFLSPLLFAGDIMSFPFIVIEFILFSILSLNFRVKKCLA